MVSDHLECCLHMYEKHNIDVNLSTSGEVCSLPLYINDLHMQKIRARLVSHKKVLLICTTLLGAECSAILSCALRIGIEEQR